MNYRSLATATLGLLLACEPAPRLQNTPTTKAPAYVNTDSIDKVYRATIDSVRFNPERCSRPGAIRVASDEQVADLWRSYINKNFERIQIDQKGRFASSVPAVHIQFKALDALADALYGRDTITIIERYPSYPGVAREAYNCQTQEEIDAYMEEMLRHEYWHHELDHWFKEKGWEHWDRDPPVGRARRFPWMILNEGITTYLGIRSMPKEKQAMLEPKFLDQHFDSISGSIKYHNIGFRIVAPVIDKHGDKAIEYFYTHPLTARDTANLLGYRRKAMHALDSIALADTIR